MMTDLVLGIAVAASASLAVSSYYLIFYPKNRIVTSEVGTKRYSAQDELAKRIQYKLSGSKKRQQLIASDPLLNWMYGEKTQ